MNDRQKAAMDEALRQLKLEKDFKSNKNAAEFLKERKLIRDKIKKRTPMNREYLKMYQECEKDSDTFIGRMAENMKKIIKQQEVLKRAAKLCKDANDQRELLQQSEELNNSQAIKDYRTYLKGLKYIAGLEAEKDPEVEKFFLEQLYAPISKDREFEEYRMVEETSVKNSYEKCAKEYQKMVAETKAQKMFGFSGLISFSAMKNQFFSKYPDIGKGDKGVFRGRQTPINICVGMMLRQGYSLEQILDPEQLREVKEQVGELYYQKREEQDVEWYADELYYGSEEMMNAISNYAYEHKEELKDFKGLSRHANKLGLFCQLCFDRVQEIDYFKGVDKNLAAYVKKTDEELERFKSERLMQYRCGAAPFANKEMTYEFGNVSSMTSWITQQIALEQFYKEMGKEQPNLENAIMSMDDEICVRMHPSVLPEVYKLYRDEDRISGGNMTREKAKLMGEMANGKYVKDQQITVRHLKKPLTILKEPQEAGELSYSSYPKGTKLDAVLLQKGKMIFYTDRVFGMDRYTEKLNEQIKKIQGDEKKNSREFSELLTVCRNAYTGIMGMDFEDKDYSEKLKENMDSMKRAAAAYISAKREQKGYDSKDATDQTLNRKMLGLEKGEGAIFTSAGKERYAFAVQIIETISKMENDRKEMQEEKGKKGFENEEDMVLS